MRTRWLSRRAITLHVSVLLWVPGCLLAGWWQVTRAMGGNSLSYLYSVEWPVFAIVGVYAWWSLVHTDPDTVGARAQRRLLAARAPALVADPPPSAAGAAPTAKTDRRPPGVSASPLDRRRDEEDEALAAYNDRLAELARTGATKSWRRR